MAYCTEYKEIKEENKELKQKKNEDLKKRMNHTKEIFGYPSANRAMRMLRSWSGEYEEITINENNSVLPKWFLEKGLMNMYDFLKSKADIKRSIFYLKKSANRKNRSKDGKHCDLFMIKKDKEELKQFKIEYFQASDVEKLVRLIIEKKG